VPVNLAQVLKPGDRFEIHNVQNLSGPPVVSGVYRGEPVELPMGPVPVAAALGNSDRPTPTGPVFNAFIVRTTSGQAPPAQEVQAAPVASNADSPPAAATTRADSSLQKYVGTFRSKNAHIVVSLGDEGLKAQFVHEPGHPTYALSEVSS